MTAARRIARVAAWFVITAAALGAFYFLAVRPWHRT